MGVYLYHNFKNIENWSGFRNKARNVLVYDLHVCVKHSLEIYRFLCIKKKTELLRLNSKQQDSHANKLVQWGQDALVIRLSLHPTYNKKQTQLQSSQL